MFCDLVGSTSIAARLDAEEWRDLVSAYVDAASAAVKEMGGYVAKKLGDGLMALFGYPVAQENDGERAARAALSIQRTLAEVNRKNASTGKPMLNARIGIENGPVVVDAGGEIYGDAPNVAARVQALAELGTVVVTARVQRQIVGLFVAEECGSHELKGVPEPVTLFRLVRASGGGRRSGQRHLTPLVGRDEEIAMLMRRGANAALLAPLLDIPLPPERAVALPPEELRRRQLAALINLVIAGARAQPAVLILEDLHWADPTTLDLQRPPISMIAGRRSSLGRLPCGDWPLATRLA